MSDSNKQEDINTLTHIATEIAKSLITQYNYSTYESRDSLYRNVAIDSVAIAKSIMNQIKISTEKSKIP